MFFIRVGLPLRVGCGKGMGWYQDSIKNFSWLISACGATAFYQPSGWANFPRMIPDPSGWTTGASAHTQPAAWNDPRWQVASVDFSLRQTPHCLKHVHHHLWSKAICTGPSSPLFPATCTKHTLTVEGVDHLYHPENILVNGCLWHGSGVTCRPCWLEKRWQKYSTDQN